MPNSTRQACAVLAALAASIAAHGCRRAPDGAAPPNSSLTPATHARFPISSGVHAVSCNACHGGFETFKQFDCLGCHGHEQSITDELHRSLTSAGGMLPDGGGSYAYASASCLSCHATGERVPFDHAGVASSCATCHDSGAQFDPLPVAGVGLDGGAFVHPDKKGNDCAACHTTASWVGASSAPDNVRDPSQDVPVDAGVPSYAGTSIPPGGITFVTEALPMPMVHSSKQMPAGVSCISCHATANAGDMFPGQFHQSLVAAAAPQPTACFDCHVTSVPTGFVGPSDSRRSPASGEMKHDAVLWSLGKPTKTPAVAQECSTCHLAPPTPNWATPIKFHAAVKAQPSSCLDCHANSRPGILTSATPAALPPGVSFDHGAALGECMTCHTGYSSWQGGKFHVPANGTPSSCLPCHEGERPTSGTSGGAPFDYGTNAAGITHGGGQDCIACHAGSAATQDWGGGSFTHGAGTMSASTCIACHSTQRPDLNGITPSQLPNSFDHSLNGTGDCFGCHQATVTRASYSSFTPIPGSDWQGGIGYPGPVLISAPTQFITVNEIRLTRSGPNNLVTGSTTVSTTYYNAMLHTSLQVPASMRPGGANPSTDYFHCAMCHTVNSTTGAGSFANGQFHSAVTTAGQAQPTQCLDCHSQMRPNGIVEKSASDLQPMDHAAAFTSGSVATMDCTSCHSHPGTAWSDGVFHANIAAAQPQDCAVCHYPAMADAAKADLTVSPGYAMKHGSGQITFQNCAVCHTAALGKATTGTVATLWSPGVLHSHLTPQPASCNECHSPVSKPLGATQSTASYALALGATSSNQRQWMNHASSSVVGKDCAVCHAADAAPGVTAWSQSDSYHAAVPAGATCTECHGTGNGSTAIGTNNNLPVGLTNSSMVSSAASDPSTGVPSGTHDQITHADVNSASHDCNFCHTQPGVNWAAGSFHTSFTSANPLVMNGSTGRCSNCHINVKPTSQFTAFDHSGFTATAGTQDCNSCHTWPGTGTAQSPNWLGATGAPAFVTLTGFTSPSTDITFTGNSVRFPHPSAASYTSCAQCHFGTTYNKIVDYNHDGLTSNVTFNGAAQANPNLGSSQYNASTNPTFCVFCHDSGTSTTRNPWIATTGLSSTITASTTAGSTTVATPSSANLTLGMSVSGVGASTSTFTATTTSGSTTVTTASPVWLPSGASITGTGIPSPDSVATTVANATTFTLRTAATASGTTTLTATANVTIKTIPSSTSFTISTPSNQTTASTTLTVTHRSISMERIGNHPNPPPSPDASTSGQDCTSCHYQGSNIARLTPPTPGLTGFGTGTITGN